MTDEFTIVDRNNIFSISGFSVECGLPYWVAYRDSRGESRIGAELLAYSQSTQRWGMLLYMNSPFSSFPDGTDDIEKARILQNIKRAVWHLGYEADQSQI